jgi:hypothetical protein
VSNVVVMFQDERKAARDKF